MFFFIVVVDNFALHMQCRSVDEAKQFLLEVSALNFQVSLQDFTVIYFCPLEVLSDVYHAMKSEDLVQVAICSFTDKVNGESQKINKL